VCTELTALARERGKRSKMKGMVGNERRGREVWGRIKQEKRAREGIRNGELRIEWLQCLLVFEVGLCWAALLRERGK
jgi:hypothetical protein